MISYNLYLITDPAYSDEKIIDALNAKVDVVQLREKNISSKAFYEKALKYKNICKQHNTKFIINDRVDIALAVDADGLHIGQSDLELKICRKIFPNKIIGVSATNLNEAIKAQQDGADYIGVGSMFPTITKNDAKFVTIDELKQIQKCITIPIVCIGGINLQNINELTKENINNFAICSEILNKPSPSDEVKNFRAKI